MFLKHKKHPIILKKIPSDIIISNDFRAVVIKVTSMFLCVKQFFVLLSDSEPQRVAAEEASRTAAQRRGGAASPADLLALFAPDRSPLCRACCGDSGGLVGPTTARRSRRSSGETDSHPQV